jgi:FAD/FMN-containing dehydrogenase
VGDAASARVVSYRPLAILETESGASVFVAGTAEEVAAQAADLGATARDGLHWPEPLDTSWVLSLRIPAAHTAAAVGQVRALLGAVRFQAAHGVGEVTIGLDALDDAAATRLRTWAEERGGTLVVLRRPDGDGVPFDPWGTPPATVELQRRIKAAFDPAGVVNPGRLPGRI